MADLRPSHEQRLYERVAEILDQTRLQVARTINAAMVQAYWLVGHEIVEVEQQGGARGVWRAAARSLAARLAARFGRSFGVAMLRRVRAFYVAYPKGSAIQEVAGSRRIGSTPLIESEREPRATTGTEAELPHSAFPPILSWSHYLALLRVQSDQARAFYEIEAAREAWSVRELERQIAVSLFERLAANWNPDEVRSRCT